MVTARGRLCGNDRYMAPCSKLSIRIRSSPALARRRLLSWDRQTIRWKRIFRAHSGHHSAGRPSGQPANTSILRNPGLRRSGRLCR
jgi:hypothetical protein